MNYKSEFADGLSSALGHFPSSWTRASVMEDASVIPDVLSALDEVGLNQLVAPEWSGGFSLGLIDLVAVNSVLGRHLLLPEVGLWSAAAGGVLRALDSTDQGSTALAHGIEQGGHYGIGFYEQRSGWWKSPEAKITIGNSQMTLLGSKPWILGGVHAAGHLISITDEAKKEQMLFLPDSDSGSRPIQTVTKVGIDSASSFRNLSLGSGQILKPANSGISIVESSLVALTFAAAGQAIGVAEWCLETMVLHAKQRTQFGKPIGAFQAVQHICAEARRVVEGIEALTLFAAQQVDEAHYAWSPSLSCLRAHIANVLPLLGERTLHILGGIGFTDDHPLHHYWKYSMYLSALLGGEEDLLTLAERYWLPDSGQDAFASDNVLGLGV